MTEFVVKLVGLSVIPRIPHSGTLPCCPLTLHVCHEEIGLSFCFFFIVCDRKNLVKCFFLNYFFYFLRLNTIFPFPFLSSNPTTCLPCSILLSLHNATSVHIFRADHWSWITNCYILPRRRLFLLPGQSLVASLCEVEA